MEQGEYKRPTKIIDLPSGKKVEVITFFSQEEMGDIRSKMVAGQKISGEKLWQMEVAKEKGDKAMEATLLEGMNFEMSTLDEASKFTRRLAIKKLIDNDGKDYKPTEEGIRGFFSVEDGEALDIALNGMNKKKLKKEN